MRIVMVMDYYRPHTTGVVVSVERLTEGLLRRGHDVAWVLPENSDPPPFDIELARFPTLPRLTSMPTRTLARSRALEKFVADNLQPQVVHIHQPFLSFVVGRAIAQRVNALQVLTAHTMFPRYGHFSRLKMPGMGTLLGLVLKHAARSVDNVVVPSVAARNYLTALGLRSPMEVIPTGIDLAAYSPTSSSEKRRLRSALGIDDNRTVFLQCGHLTAEKNPTTTVEALAAPGCEHAFLVFVGDGPLRAEIEYMARRHGVEQRVLFTGAIKQERVVDYYRLSDYLVHPGTSEFQGLVVLEALSCGLPVICPPGTAQSEYVRDGHNGIIVEATGPSFGRAMASCVHARPMRAFASVAARESVMKSGIDVFAATMEALYLRGRATRIVP